MKSIRFSFPLIFWMLILIVGVPLLPLLISRRWDWWEAWVFAAANILGFAVSRYLAARKHPDLLAERSTFMQHSDTPLFDKVLAPLAGLSGGLIPLTAGLDELLGWSPAYSMPMKILALTAILAGFLLASYAMISNRFFSGNVRIQAEREHRVVTGGPYRWIRHPGYAGSLLANLASPIFLDSTWTLIPSAAAILVLILRAHFEDRFLQENLTGYRDYAGRVRFRLIPGIW